jgi:hypothetical protein
MAKAAFPARQGSGRLTPKCPESRTLFRRRPHFTTVVLSGNLVTEFFGMQLPKHEFLDAAGGFLNGFQNRQTPPVGARC